MTKMAGDESAYLHVLRVFIFSFLKGTAPILAVEVARRAIPGHVRPSFQEVEKACRGGGEPSGRGSGFSVNRNGNFVKDSARPIIIIKKKVAMANITATVEGCLC